MENENEGKKIFEISCSKGFQPGNIWLGNGSYLLNRTLHFQDWTMILVFYGGLGPLYLFLEEGKQEKGHQLLIVDQKICRLRWGKAFYGNLKIEHWKL